MGKKGILAIAVILVGGAISALGEQLIGEYVFAPVREKATGMLTVNKEKEEGSDSE